MDATFDSLAVQEAIQVLGYLKSSAESSILQLLQPSLIEHPRSVCTRYRSTGEQLSREEKRTLGIRSNAFLSRRAFEELTGRGKALPLRAHEVTLFRAQFTIARKRTVDRLWGADFSDKLRLNTSFKHEKLFPSCAGCARLAAWGKVPAERVQVMPPIDCAHDACNLSVAMVVNWLGAGSRPA